MDNRDYINRIQQLEALVQELKTQNDKLKAMVTEYKNKEQTISSAIIASIENANQVEASRKKLYSLDIQRSRLMYLRMEQVINDLYLRYPELKKDIKLRDLSERFKSMVFNDLNEKTKENSLFDRQKLVVDDPIKKLLRNIIDCFDTKKIPEEEFKQIDPMAELMKTPNYKFDFNEALHPTMELDEIMKAFNVEDDKQGQKN